MTNSVVGQSASLLGRLFLKRTFSSLQRPLRPRIVPPPEHRQRRWKTIDPSTIGPGLIKPEDRIKVTFHCDGEKWETYGKAGDSLLDVVVDRDIPLDGFGACEGTLACSTCHCVLSKADYERLPEEPIDEELDMLDLAYGLTDTSRLGCQIELTKELEGLELTVPAGRTDARLSD